MQIKLNKKQYKLIIYFFEIISALLILYLIFFPIYPEFKYNFFDKKKIVVSSSENIADLKKDTESQINFLPQAEFDISSDRLIIKKIGVNIPIVVSTNSDYGLSKGAWLDPEGSRPDKGGNTVITGHRFKYLPPSNMTFYLLHKLEKGDFVSVLWKDEYYFYRVIETKIVEPEDLSILEQTNDSIIPLYTCDPIYSQKNRLVIKAELLVNDKNDI